MAPRRTSLRCSALPRPFLRMARHTPSPGFADAVAVECTCIDRTVARKVPSRIRPKLQLGGHAERGRAAEEARGDQPDALDVVTRLDDDCRVLRFDAPSFAAEVAPKAIPPPPPCRRHCPCRRPRLGLHRHHRRRTAKGRRRQRPPRRRGPSGARTCHYTARCSPRRRGPPPVSLSDLSGTGTQSRSRCPPASRTTPRTGARCASSAALAARVPRDVADTQPLLARFGRRDTCLRVTSSEGCGTASTLVITAEGDLEDDTERDVLAEHPRHAPFAATTTSA